MIKTAQYLESIVRVFFSQILRGDEGTRIDVGQIDDVDTTGFAVVDIT